MSLHPKSLRYVWTLPQILIVMVSGPSIWSQARSCHNKTNETDLTWLYYYKRLSRECTPFAFSSYNTGMSVLPVWGCFWSKTTFGSSHGNCPPRYCHCFNVNMICLCCNHQLFFVLGERNLSCYKCGKTFNQCSNLTTHIKCVHGSELSVFLHFSLNTVKVVFMKRSRIFFMKNNIA